MTLLELLTHLRRNILYDTGGQDVSWQDLVGDEYNSVQLRWSNEELVENINEAIFQVYRRINPIKDLEELETEVGESTYSIPSYISKILEIRRSDGTSLREHQTAEEADNILFNNQRGDVVKYYSDYLTNQIKLYMVPDKVDTLSMLVYRYPKSKLSFENTDAVPELAEQFQLPMLYYAAAKCYQKDEPNASDPRAADRNMALFDREFPFTSAYSNVVKSRTRNRPIKYGGL